MDVALYELYTRRHKSHKCASTGREETNTVLPLKTYRWERSIRDLSISIKKLQKQNLSIILTNYKAPRLLRRLKISGFIYLQRLQCHKIHHNEKKHFTTCSLPHVDYLTQNAVSVRRAATKCFFSYWVSQLSPMQRRDCRIKLLLMFLKIIFCIISTKTIRSLS